MSKLDQLRSQHGANASSSVKRHPDGTSTLGVIRPPAGAKMAGVEKIHTAMMVPVGRIAPDPGQPRKAIDEEELDRLAETMRGRGVIQPLRVRWDESSEKWIVVAGERRWRAAVKAGLASVPCVEHSGDESALRLDQLIENCARVDLSHVDQAIAFKALIEGSGWTQARVAKEIGVSTSHVSRVLRVLELPEDVQDDVARGNIPVKAAYKMASSLPVDEAPEDAPAEVKRVAKIRQARKATPKKRTEWSHGFEDGTTVTVVIPRPDATFKDVKKIVRAILTLPDPGVQ